MNNVNEYRNIIEKFARERVNQRVSNGMAVHASILLETMFKQATAEIRIYTGELNQIVFAQDGIINAAKQFLTKPYASLLILVQKEQNSEWEKAHPFLKAIKDMDAPHGNIELRYATDSFKSDDKLKHFAVMDNDGYRVEINHDKCEAVANFNEPRVAIGLIKLFDDAFHSARPNHIEQKIA